MKKILIISHNFYPKVNPRTFRTYEILKIMLKHDHKIDFITETKFDIKDYFNENDNLKIFYIKDKNYDLKKDTKKIHFLKKIGRYILGEKEMVNLFKGLKLLRLNTKDENYDLIMSIGLPFYFHIALYLSRLLNKKNVIKICDCGDPFYENKFYKIAPYFKIIQKIIFKKFDYIFIPIKEATIDYKKYKNIENIYVVPQYLDYKSIKIADYKEHEIPTFAYAGTFHKTQRDPEKLLQILTKIKVPFQFTIYTSCERNNYFTELLIKYKQILGTKLEIKEMIPRNQCIYELSQYDFLIDLKNINITQKSSKLIDYACTKRPIYSVDIRSKTLEKDIYMFLNKDYRKKVQINIRDYDIEIFYSKIMELMN